MDLVVNHTSDEHPWFVESRSSTDNPKRDWYIWRTTPNNWQSIFSGSAWEHDPITDEYYLHLFSRKQPDLNWENPEVRAAVYAMMRWWVERGVDGFRMDVINLISKPAGLPDGDALGVVRQRPAGARVPRRDAPRGARRTGAARRGGDAGRAPSTTPAATPTRPGPRSTWCSRSSTWGWTRARSKWDLRPLRLTELKANLSAWQDGLAEVGWNSLYWDNHDQPRIVSRWGDDGEHRVASAKTLATVLHLLRGTPYVYQGEELGMTNAYFTELADYRDIESVNWAKGAIAAGPDDARGAALARGEVARQRPHPDAVGRLAAGGLHHRHALAAGERQPRRDQRRGRAQGPGLGVPPLPAS